MNSDTTRGDQVPVLTSRVPRWLHALALVLMGVLVTLVLALVLGYLTAGPVTIWRVSSWFSPRSSQCRSWRRSLLGSPEARYKVGPRG